MYWKITLLAGNAQKTGPGEAIRVPSLEYSYQSDVYLSIYLFSMSAFRDMEGIFIGAIIEIEPYTGKPRFIVLHFILLHR